MKNLLGGYQILDLTQYGVISDNIFDITKENYIDAYNVLKSYYDFDEEHFTDKIVKKPIHIQMNHKTQLCEVTITSRSDDQMNIYGQGISYDSYVSLFSIENAGSELFRVTISDLLE